MIPLKEPELFGVDIREPDTPARESLASIVIRLAAANDVSCGRLVDLRYNGTGGVNPIRCCLRSLGRSAGQSINGKRAYAQAFARRTEELASLKNLSASTAIGFGEVSTRNGLLRRTFSWSPQFMAQQEVPYHPLVWAFEAVRVCPITRTPLISVCPNPRCRRELPTFAGTSMIDRCCRCGTGFHVNPGKNISTDPLASSIRSMDYEVWVADQIGDCIAAIAKGSDIAPYSFHRVLQHWFDLFEIRTPGEAAKLTGSGDFAISNWLNQEAIPRLRSTLNLSWVFGVSLRDFLSLSVPNDHDGRLRGSVEPNARQIGKSRRVPIDRRGLEQHLAKIIKKDLYPDSSFAEICRSKIKRNEVTVREYYPDLAKMISARFLKNRRETAQKKRRIYAAAIRAAALEVYREGKIPNHKNLKEYIKPYSILRSEWAMAELHAIRAQLGFEIPDPQLELPFKECV